jgi:hypothetical protein
MKPRTQVTIIWRVQNSAEVCPGSNVHFAIARPPDSDLDVVRVTPSPRLAWLERPDNRVLCLMEVFGRVPVRRVIAAGDVSAFEAQSQVNPARADLQTILAAFRARRDVAYLIQVRTGGHEISSTSVAVSPAFNIAII